MFISMLEVITLSLSISVLLNLILFLFAYKNQSDKLTDISYSLSFIVLALLALSFAKQIDGYSAILFLMVVLWGIRIGAFLLLRILKVGKDKRFDTLRSSFVDFGKFWLAQAITAWVLMLPVTIGLFRGGSIGALAIIGFGVWAVGLIIETIADLQKIKFRDNPKNKGKWIESGIWNYSRHPNYFGEILVWIGVYLYSFPGLSTYEKLICLSSPLLISIVLLFVSGVPILEKNADIKWGNHKDYIDYKKRTSLLILLPKQKPKSR